MAANQSVFESYFHVDPRIDYKESLINDYQNKDLFEDLLPQPSTVAPRIEDETSKPPLGYEFENDDAAWIMACTFMIFTKQTGFGLIESGMCSLKNEVNIMVKNAVDVAVSGMTFWMFGFGLITGESEYSNPFCGFGNFFFSPGE